MSQQITKMINRAHLLLNGDPDRSLVCGVCHDLYHDPILCSAGHSWCRHCMRGLANSRCPLCLSEVNVNSAPRNLSLQSMIDGMLVRCPHNQSVGAKRARIEDGTGAGVAAGAAFAKAGFSGSEPNPQKIAIGRGKWRISLRTSPFVSTNRMSGAHFLSTVALSLVPRRRWICTTFRRLTSTARLSLGSLLHLKRALQTSRPRSTRVLRRIACQASPPSASIHSLAVSACTLAR